MKILGQFLIGLISAILIFGLLGPVRFAIIESEVAGLLLLATFLGPVLVPFICLAFGSLRKAAGFCTALTGMSLITIPIGLSGLFNDMAEELDKAETKNLAEAASKSLLQDAMSMFGQSLVLFGGLVGLFLIIVGVLIFRSQNEIQYLPVHYQ